ncbi:MAG TPA: type II toxin-antitoxin system HicA family toxin [Ktedonobacterales bacterium]|nr:type II toxin-antitoxin system HicA family toxin [Ktedonobacterales bacterium]
MPRKKREIRSDLRRLGFVESSGKGSHTNFRHPRLPYIITVSGGDGDDAKPYDEDNVRRAKKDLRVQ